MHQRRRTALWLAGLICLYAFCSFGCAAIAAFPGATGSGIVINEVVAGNANSLRHDLLGSPDWIELHNPTGASVNIGGYGLSDKVRNPRKYMLPDITLAPGEYLILYACQYEGELPDGVYCTGFGLSISGETLLLTDRASSMIQQLEIPTLKQDISYARDESGNYGFCATPTPGAPNTAQIVSGLEAIGYVERGAGLLLDEAVPNNQNGLMALDGQRYAWAELINSSGSPILLSDYWLSDDSANPKKHKLPETTLDAGDRVLVYFSGGKAADDEIHASFKLNSDEDALFLSGYDGEIVDALYWEAPLFADIAVVRTEGGKEYTAYPTPGEENDARTFENPHLTPMDAGDPVIINEVLPRNRYSIMDVDGDRPEWLELYNRSDQAVSLSGYFLSDKEDEPFRWALPDIMLGAGDYLILFLSGKAQPEGELHAPFRLSDKDGAITLVNIDGLRADTLPLPADIPENVSMGRNEDGELRYFAYPTPLAQNDGAGFDHAELVPKRSPDSVFISEVSAVSAAKSGKKDWVEFYNPADKDIHLDGWYLSNDRSDPLKYRIETLKVPAKGHALLYASDRTPLITEGVADFNIGSGAGELLLSDKSGIVRDYYQTGALRAGLSSGRNESDPIGDRVFYTSSTPGQPNSGQSYTGYAGMPIFSTTGLYRTEPFSLTLASPTPGADIYYTLDGSKPTDTSTLYTGPIEISANTGVRAISVCDGLLNSDVVTHTYLFETPHTLPVICISGAPEDISSVYAATIKAERVERETHAEYFEANGRLGVAFPCGLRASGASTLTAAQKSFTIFMRGGYGRSAVTYPFFGDYHIDTFSSLVIRNSGQDRGKARLRDSFASLAAEGLFIDNVATRPVVVYLNGKYWGLYDLNENQNEDFLAAHYGADPDAVDIIRRNISALAGKNTDFKRVRAYGVGKDFSSDAVYDEYLNWVDMDYVMDYLIVQTFFANYDMFNQKYWRSHDYTVKWRPMLFDMDFALSSTSATQNLLPAYFRYEGVPSQDGSITNMDLFCGLPKNARWREQFAARYVYVVTNHLNADRLTALLDDVANTLRPEMARHIARWKAPSSMASWESAVSALRDCLKKRPEYALKHVQNYFNVTDARMEEYKTGEVGA